MNRPVPRSEDDLLLPVSLCLDGKDRDRLDKFHEETGISRSKFLRAAVKKALDEYESRKGDRR